MKPEEAIVINDWIPCNSGRLPVEDDAYIVTWIDARDIEFYGTASYDPENGEWDGSNLPAVGAYEVIAWMDAEPYHPNRTEYRVKGE